MIITFNDASTLEAVSVRITDQDALAVITMSSNQSDLSTIFRDSLKTKTMIVTDTSGNKTTYEGYTTFDAIIKYSSGAFGVIMFRPKDTPKAKAEVQLAAIKVAQIQAQAFNDEQALAVSAIFPQWDENAISYVVGYKVIYDDKLYKCLQDHTSQSDWAPIASPSLWAEVLAGQEGTDIGVWTQPDSTNPYMTGDKVYYPTENDSIYESLIDNNIWSPTDYPSGWKLITD